MDISEADRSLLNKHVTDAFSKLRRTQFEQEPAYVIAFVARLLGKVQLTAGRYIDFQTSSTNDRGPGSAESVFGGDFGIVLTWSGTGDKKAILGQAKNGNIAVLKGAEQLLLRAQCQKMTTVTSHFVVLQCPDLDGAEPEIFLGEDQSWVPPPIGFAEFILDRMIGCTYGDTDAKTAERIQRSDLKTLIKIKTNIPKPQPTQGIKPRRPI